MQTKTHLTDYLRFNAKKYSGQPALVCSDRTLTWEDLWQETQAIASYFSPKLKSDKQQVVAVLMPNSWQYVVTYLAIVHLGHIVEPIDVIYKPLEIEAILKQIPPVMVVTDRANRPRVNYDAVEVEVFEDIHHVDQPGEANLLRLPPQKQIASLLFTSGTTGKPKAAPYTHSNHIWNIEVCSKIWDWSHDDSLLISLRMSHWYGLVMGLSGALYYGNTLYLQERFEPQETLRSLASGKISLFTHGPLVYAKLLDVEGNYDLSKVRLFISGSGPLPPQIWHDFKRRFGAEILEVYGSSETGRIASNLLNERLPGSPGRVLPGVELDFGKTGEVLVKSPGVFPGYYDNSQATRQGRSSGFWRTGDTGELVQGRLVLKGRVQEKIRKQGYTISPRDIEWALYQLPAIKETHVIGVETPGTSGDQIIYFLTGDISEDEVMEFSKTNMPSVWRPDKIIKLDSLPKTRNGKTDLRKLKAML